MKPTYQTSFLLLPGFVFAAFGFTGGVTAKHAGGLCTVRWPHQIENEGNFYGSTKCSD